MCSTAVFTGACLAALGSSVGHPSPSHPALGCHCIPPLGSVGGGGCWKAEGQTAQGSAWRGVRCWHSMARDGSGVVLSVLGGQWWSPTPRDGPTPHTPAALGCVSLTCCRSLDPNDGLHCCMCQHPAWGADAALLPALSSALQSAEALNTVC